MLRDNRTGRGAHDSRDHPLALVHRCLRQFPLPGGLHLRCTDHARRARRATGNRPQSAPPGGAADSGATGYGAAPYPPSLPA